MLASTSALMSIDSSKNACRSMQSTIRRGYAIRTTGRLESALSIGIEFSSKRRGTADKNTNNDFTVYFQVN
jgi:hypothetical protein